MSHKLVLDSLQRATKSHRLVFWYDAHGEWQEAFGEFTAPGVEKITVAGTEFGTKVRITRHSRPDQRFLVYIPSARPVRDADNWLLDLVLQGHEFKADRASLALQQAGLSYDFKDLAERHIGFFRSDKRTTALRELLTSSDQSADIRLKMMAVLTNTAVSVDDLLLHFLRKGPDADGPDPAKEGLGIANLQEPFWKEVARLFGYAGLQPSVVDFAGFLFSAANPLDGRTVMRPHAKVFLQRWKDSREHSGSFEAWSKELQQRLHIASGLEAQGAKVQLGDCDTFEIFDQFIIHQLCAGFARSATAQDLRAIVQQRKAVYWRKHHSHGYDAVEQAIELRELMKQSDLAVPSIDDGLRRYTAHWWRIDQAYRRCVWHLRQYNQTKVMAEVEEWVERAYVTLFLLPLADRWSDHVVQLAEWKCEALRPQRQFFSEYVQPFLSRDQKVFVVISDALRYEAAADFVSQLNAENRWSAEVEAMLGSLPSYTQLGMAALLPGKELALDLQTAQVSVAGRSATGMANRGGLLNDACSGRAAVLSDEEFLRMNSKTEGRDLMRDHDVIYIFHNKIDKVGDDRQTESDAFEAVQGAFAELTAILKKIANVNGNNMLITADHGFLFQQDDIAESDLLPFPTGVEWTYQNRRFALSRARPSGPGVKTFSAQQLGLSGDGAATFPLSLGRFPRSGSGKRFVHGGFSLQEVVVPVVRVRKARGDDAEPVEVDFMRVPPTITTGQFSLSVVQVKAAVGKTQPRTLRLAVFLGHEQLSDAKTLVFDSTDMEPRNREQVVVLTMAGAADKYNGKDVDVRLDEEHVPGSGRFGTYRQHKTRLHKPFGKDFDD